MNNCKLTASFVAQDLDVACTMIERHLCYNILSLHSALIAQAVSLSLWHERAGAFEPRPGVAQSDKIKSPCYYHFIFLPLVFEDDKGRVKIFCLFTIRIYFTSRKYFPVKWMHCSLFCVDVVVDPSRNRMSPQLSHQVMTSQPDRRPHFTPRPAQSALSLKIFQTFFIFKYFLFSLFQLSQNLKYSETNTEG